MAENTRDPKTTEEKQTFIAKAVKADSSLSMYQIGEMVKQEFGTMIAFGKLREAFLSAGGELGKRGRRKGSKNQGAGKAKAKAAKAPKAVKAAAKPSTEGFSKRDP